MGKTAIIMGATGLTGSILVDLLLEDPRYDTVRLISRSTLGKDHPKLEEHLIDMHRLSDHPSLFKGDELFCCIGTTKAKTPDKEAYRAIDYHMPVNAAMMASETGVHCFVVMSSLGADPRSSVFYSRLKGEMEAAVLELGLPKTLIIRPSLIAGKRDEKRLGEQLGKWFMKLLDPLMIGPLKGYRAIYPQQIARAMICLANKPTDKSIYESEELKELSQHEHRNRA